jgi:hypothetical protein
MLKEIAQIIEEHFESPVADMGFTYDVTQWFCDNEYIVEIDCINYEDSFYDFSFSSGGFRMEKGKVTKEIFLANLKTNCIELVKQLEDELDANTPDHVKNDREKSYREEQRADEVRLGL